MLTCMQVFIHNKYKINTSQALLNACQALIDQSVRHYGIRHFGIRHSGNHPIGMLYYYNTDKCTDKHEA